MKKIKDDPLFSIFKKVNNEIIEEIDSINNISNFFEFITSTKTPEDSKIGVLENITIIFKNNKYICDFFSSYNNKSIYLYLFDIYLSKDSSDKLKTAIVNLLNELLLVLETKSEIYEYLFQNISKIYSKDNTTQEKTPQNLYNHLFLLNTLLLYRDTIPKQKNYFSLSGNGKFILDLKDKQLNIGYCMSFILTFRTGQEEKSNNVSKLFHIKFSNNTSISLFLKYPNLITIKEGDKEESTIKGFFPNDFIVLAINLIVENNELKCYCFVNGENTPLPVNYKNNLDLNKDFIEYLEFFDNFYGQVTSLTMFTLKGKAEPTINSKTFLPTLKNFQEGFHKKKIINQFLETISKESSIENESINNKILSGTKLIDNLVFMVTPFNYFNSSWEVYQNKNENKIIDDYFGKYNILILDKDNSIKNHKFQCYQKKLYLVCNITNFLPIVELFLIQPQLLTEQNLKLYLQIIGNLIKLRKRNVEMIKDNCIFESLSLFLEKYPNQIFTETILNELINIGMDMFKSNFVETEKIYFNNILLNEKILSNFSPNLQITFWEKFSKFCESDYDQLGKILEMNRICLILRFYDKNRYNEMCCKTHLDMFQKQYIKDCIIMEPSMDKKLANLLKIIDIVINSPEWALNLFKLLLLDLSPCLTNFIITSIIMALIMHNDDNNNNNEMMGLNACKTIVFVRGDNDWLKQFMKQLIDNKYESIIINTFIHSMPDVRFNILKLIYQIFQTLILLEKKDDFKIFFKMMKKYLLPKKMFYSKNENKENLVLNEGIMKKYLKDAINLFTHWALDDKLNLIKNSDNIDFQQNNNIEKGADIKNCDIFEIVFELIKQTNYDIELIIQFLDILSKLVKNESNCDTLLYNEKIFLMLVNLIYECYKLKIHDNKKDKNIEKCFSLGKSIIGNIYINALIFKHNKYICEYYVFNEINLLFLLGDKIIFKYNNPKNQDVKKNVFSFIHHILMEILTYYKVKIFPKMNKQSSIENIKNNFIREYYHQNYLILLYKLFEFSFEYSLDSFIKEDQLNSVLPQPNAMGYHNLFITSMRTDKSTQNSISLYWNDYIFFDELYSKISYMWKKDYLFKDYEKDKIKNKNKIQKYEYILENIILDKKKRNNFKNELELLCAFYINEKPCSISNNDILILNCKISFIKQIQITITSMLSVIISMRNEGDLLKWLKELKHFIIFLIIASSNLYINEKEKKEPNEIMTFSSYNNIQEQCLYTIYNCLYFLNELRSPSPLGKQKIDKYCVNIFSLCFVILRKVYSFNKRHSLSLKLSIHKNNFEDLSHTAIFSLFNDYIKDKSKEKGDSILITLDLLNKLLDEKNYSENIINFLNDKNWNDSFNNCKINDVLTTKYFPISEYKNLAMERIDYFKKTEEESNSQEAKWEYSDDEILKLLPLYEKELVQYSNNSLEMNITKKNVYKNIKKNLFSWRGFWSDRTIFYPDAINNENEGCNKDNDSIVDKNNVSKLKVKLINHYTKSLMKPLLVPILDISYYLPDFSGFDPKNLFNIDTKCIVNMDIDKLETNKEEDLTPKKEDSKENYLKKIYTEMNQDLADELLKVSDTIDFGKEEFLLDFEKVEKEEIDKENTNQEDNKDKNYYLACLVKTSHHIKGVMFVEENCINFKVFLNQKTGNELDGMNIGFTDKDHDYDKDRKTCFGSYFMFHEKDKNLYNIAINYNDVNIILLKRYYYNNSGLELFTKTNKSYYFNFKFDNEREQFINKILLKLTEPKTLINDLKEGKDNILGYYTSSKIFNEKKYTKKEKIKKEKNKKKKTVKKFSEIVKKWSNWKINNFSFLMWMNFFANRSYNDISQYPVFPWILSNYDDPFKIEPFFFNSSLYNANDESNLNDGGSRNVSISENNDIDNEKKKKKKNEEDLYNYRDLKLPMGMLEINEESKKRKDYFIELYNTIKDNKDEFEGRKPYFYGQNYSNPVYVCNFLMRLFPFTHISIELQGNKMDDPNRLFLSVNTSFNNSITQKADVRELIPEFFYLPELFLNINDIKLGYKENESMVYNVITPCNNNAFSFVEIMKRIFENDRISKYLNNWVDLIFGYKNKGKEAENAKNVYTEASYQENIDIKKQEEKESYLRLVEFGLIPTQIMSKECPKREKKKDVKEKEITDYNNRNKIKLISIKHNNSIDKSIKDSDGKKSKILKIEELNDRIFTLYDNNTIIESKIGSSSEDISCVYKLNKINNRIGEKSEKINNKIIKFCNYGMTMIIGGFYDGKIEIINIDDKNEKSRKEIYPFSEEEPILNISIDNNEKYMILGNTIGNIAIYNIDLENDKCELYKKIFNLLSPISDINISNDLNLFAISTLDGFVNLYTWPLCKLVRSIKAPIDKDNNGKINYVFLSESSLPSIIMVIEDEKKCDIFSYSINGSFLKSVTEEKDMSYPIKLKDINSYEYLVYYSNSDIKIINLPSLTIEFSIKSNSKVVYLCINDDLTAIYTYNEDGTQIQAIKS